MCEICGFFDCDYQEIKDTIDKEAVYRCMTNCYEACQVGYLRGYIVSFVRFVAIRFVESRPKRSYVHWWCARWTRR